MTTASRNQTRLRAAAVVAAVLVGVSAVAGWSAAASASQCAGARAELEDHRARMTGTQAAYAISVENGWAYHVSQLGPKVRAGEVETQRLLTAYYGAC